jgi:penicillin-binding protein 2
VNGISFDDYASLRDGEYRPLFNRALTGQYPPGSTVKPFVGLGAVESGLQGLGKKIPCIGYYQLPNDEHRYRDWKKEGHGPTNLHDSIEVSCDVFYYDLAYRWGIDRMHNYLAQFGFGNKFDIDTLGEKSGILPSSAWKRKARNQPWYPGETLIAGIGQGYFLATPLQLAVTTSALSNNGIIPQPHLLMRTQHPDGTTTENAPPSRGKVPVKKRRNWKYMKEAMEDVVHGTQGTARALGWSSKYKMASKTGTAQVFSIAQDEEYDEEKIKKKLRDHALFVVWAPSDDPAIVVSVIVENGGSGGSTAGPIAKAVMDAYLLDEQGELKEEYK